MNIKKTIRKAHLLIGLISGLGVFLIAITGCFYAFEREIKDLSQEFRFTPFQPSLDPLPPSQLRDRAQAVLPGKEPHAVLYDEPGRSARVIFYSEEPYYYDQVYLNPYDGSVLGVVDETKGFFPFILDGHFNLWLPPNIGKPLVSAITLVFAFMVISGIVLWWPRKRSRKGQRFKIKWKASWKRTNFDLHAVGGFYVCWIALIFIVTGLYYGYDWFREGYYKALTGSTWQDYEEPMAPSAKLGKESGALLAHGMEPIDHLFYTLGSEVPEGGQWEIHTPHEEGMAIGVNFNPDPSTYWKIDYRYYDPADMSLVPVSHIWGRFHELSASQKWVRMNYDVHIGAIGGLPGKILAFLASLTIASLPVTGTLIWWGRQKKQKRKPQSGSRTAKAKQVPPTRNRRKEEMPESVEPAVRELAEV